MAVAIADKEEVEKIRRICTFGDIYTTDRDVGFLPVYVIVTGISYKVIV